MGTSTSPALTTFTTVQLIAIVVVAVLVVIAMIWAVRAKRRRKAEIAEIDTVELGRSAAPAGESVPATAGAPPPPPPPTMTHPAPPAGEDDAPAKIAEPAVADADTFPPSPAAGATDDLTQLKGLGPKVAARFGELGITGLADLAALSPAEAEALDAKLGPFAGRLTRDRWVEQARYLAAGDRAGFEAEFGRLG